MNVNLFEQLIKTKDLETNEKERQHTEKIKKIP